MGVETFILIAIVIFGAVSIMLLVALRNAATRTAWAMEQVWGDILEMRKTVDARLGTQTPGVDQSESHLWDIKLNTSLIGDRTSDTARTLSSISEVVYQVNQNISQFRDELRTERLIRRSSLDFGYPVNYSHAPSLA